MSEIAASAAPPNFDILNIFRKIADHFAPVKLPVSYILPVTTSKNLLNWSLSTLLES